jgi:hypothetical protein
MCTADLEDELIRALGAGSVEQIIRAQGEIGRSAFSRGSPHSKDAAPRCSFTGSWGPGPAAGCHAP